MSIQKQNHNKYIISFLPAALKDLDKIEQKTAEFILDKIEALAVSQPNLNIKKLHTKKDLYRLRAGHFRVVYQIIHNKITILVVAIGHRKEIYQKALKRI